MTGVVVVVLVSVLCAAAVLSLIAVSHRPTEGWQEWTRQSLDAWRWDELRTERWSDAEAGVDLFSLGETGTGTGYAHPEELRLRLRTRQPAQG
ncbi:hypothetical protein PU560_05600 [Georgenia sp. 10Sc9-8]|uniref:Uncharacterized protein n=1 Tax=Georgenia halotolerans TaxID=3028317 RepID=A0ABT5TXE1_9MICO|nr:hypothetical protein [Georgenia halotolerans]